MKTIQEYRLNLDTNAIIDYVHNNLMNTSLNAHKSNKGGWQSPRIATFPKELKGLQTFVEKLIPKYRLGSLWFNSNGYGHYNALHDHFPQPIDAISGVYYFRVPDKNMGNIYFETGEEIEPEENKLLLFPAHLVHGVRPNESRKARGSLAFNYERGMMKSGIKFCNSDGSDSEFGLWI
tara:strand:- start:283 stop:816 length:534 start_codon:yes stop_codon:yes gene_type:complete